LDGITSVCPSIRSLQTGTNEHQINASRFPSLSRAIEERVELAKRSVRSKGFAGRADILEQAGTCATDKWSKFGIAGVVKVSYADAWRRLVRDVEEV
jgi:hypothetical protein